MSRTLTVTAPTPCRLAKCSEYGKEGDITGADGDEQEISMLSLHLLQSALVHLNTIFLQRVLDGGDFTLAGEDRRALSPLFRAHVNPYLDNGRTISVLGVALS